MNQTTQYTPPDKVYQPSHENRPVQPGIHLSAVGSRQPARTRGELISVNPLRAQTTLGVAHDVLQLIAYANCRFQIANLNNQEFIAT